MVLCETCHDNPIVPFKMKCNHLMCLLCIIPYVQNKNTAYCEQCFFKNNMISHEFKNVTIIGDMYSNYLWLYSSNLHDRWWCYDNENNRNIQFAYENYLANKKLLSCQPINEITIKIESNNKHFFDSYEVDSNTDARLFEIIDIDKNKDNYVCFDDLSFDENKEILSKNKQLSYTIKINSIDYMINFDTMKQINFRDPYKKRNIKRITIENKIFGCNIKTCVQYLKNTHNILGISGIKF